MATHTTLRFRHRMRLHRLASAALATTLASGITATVFAQDSAQTVTISGRNSANAASVAGFGDIPLSRSPFSASVITTRQLTDAGIASLSDVTRLDAGITDAYNAPGYWGIVAVRGFTLDNRANYRRDGLPINAETVIAQGNKQALELLKGTSGLQAGISSPGGLLNLVVKRPTGTVRQATLGWADASTRSAAIDIGDRAGAFGWRVNAGYDHIDPPTHGSQGHRHVVALATDLQLAPGLLVEAEIESSRQSQPSTPGLSVLGNRVPDASTIDPRTNLNQQPWRLPVVLSGRTGSVRLTQALGDDLKARVHAMRQRLDSDDRIAFPFGCSSENQFDRYCSDGSFDLYDFRSDGERRTTDVVDLSLSGRSAAMGLKHQFTAGLMVTRHQARFNRQAFNFVGIGRIDESAITPADPSLTDENTERRERSTELRLQDVVELTPEMSAWLGLRHSRLDRRSVRTDGSRATAYDQSFTTPWLALSHAVDSQGTAYASWGRGVETEVAPNRARFVNAGEALPAMKSRQVELGYKHRSGIIDWTVAAFDIVRPVWSDLGACDSSADSCIRRIDGTARHRGLEAELEWRVGAWSLRGSAMALKARREGADDASRNGLRPTNVPATSLKLQAAYNVAQVPGLALLGFVTNEGSRMVLPDNSLDTPGWTRLDLGLRWAQRLAGRQVVWRAGIDNLANARAWKEAPYQFDHAYLYPLAPRSLHVSAQFEL